MARGNKSEIGAENINTDGYAYVKTETGWRLKHHIIAEAKLDRKLTAMDRVYFKDGDRTNLDPDNLGVARKGASSKTRRMEKLTAKLENVIEEIEAVKAEIALDARKV